MILERHKRLHTDDNINCVKKYLPDRFNDPSLTWQQKQDILNQTYIRIQRLIQNSGTYTDDLKNADFLTLTQHAEKHNINLDKIRDPKDSNWKKHENDVIFGINNLFASGFFIRKTNLSEDKLQDNKNFKAESSGTDTAKSDVKISHGNNPKKTFYVECKLDLATSNYFKYSLSIQNNKLKYDEKFYRSRAEDSEEITQINDLFDKDINITSFLNEIISNSKIKSSWDQFLKNIINVENYISENEEFAEFVKKHKFTKTFPKDFKNFETIFDAYANHYITKYNDLIIKLFKTFDSKNLDINNYKILKHNENDNYVFNSIIKLEADIKENQLKINNKKLYDNIIKQIILIENKFNALLKTTDINGNIDNILKLETSDKTKYFFKMFISSVGQKNHKSHEHEQLMPDDLGNLNICNSIQLKTQKLAEIITNFYLKKDKVAYIQISDMIFQFSKDGNPLNIPDLPIFKDWLTTYNIEIKINDKLSHISLHINAVLNDQTKIKTFSFREKDKNYLMKMLKNGIVIEIKN